MTQKNTQPEAEEALVESLFVSWEKFGRPADDFIPSKLLETSMTSGFISSPPRVGHSSVSIFSDRSQVLFENSEILVSRYF